MYGTVYTIIALAQQNIVRLIRDPNILFAIRHFSTIFLASSIGLGTLLHDENNIVSERSGIPGPHRSAIGNLHGSGEDVGAPSDAKQGEELQK